MEHVKNQDVKSWRVVRCSSDSILSRLVKIRKFRGVKQKDLAIAIGVDPSNLSKYESGKIRPSLEILVDWCNALGCSLLVATNDYSV